MPKSKDKQVNFYAADDVYDYISKMPSGTKSTALNNIIRSHMRQQRGRQTTELEGFASWLLREGGDPKDPEEADRDPLARALYLLIDGYYRESHQAYIDGWESHGKPVPIDHRPCKYCGDDV